MAIQPNDPAWKSVICGICKEDLGPRTFSTTDTVLSHRHAITKHDFVYPDCECTIPECVDTRRMVIVSKGRIRD